MNPVTFELLNRAEKYRRSKEVEALQMVNEAQAMQFVLFLLIPSIMVSGVFWPLETMPATIRPLSYVSPLTYANAGLRKVMLAGGGFGDVQFELAVLGAFAVVMLGLSILSMRRQAYTA